MTLASNSGTNIERQGVHVRSEILLATRSSGKLRELSPMLRDAGFAPVTLDELGIAETAAEDDVEAFDSFELNAAAKAEHFFARAGGRTVLADDSGLCVDALGGVPGVRSKRWAAVPGLSCQALDAANNAKLLRELHAYENRRARYVCVAVIVSGARTVSARGECAGSIDIAPSGTSGFGYDPYFVSDELGITFGDAPEEKKRAISHRARAVHAVLAKFLCATVDHSVSAG